MLKPDAAHAPQRATGQPDDARRWPDDGARRRTTCRHLLAKIALRLHSPLHCRRAPAAPPRRAPDRRGGRWSATPAPATAPRVGRRPGRVGVRRHSWSLVDNAPQRRRREQVRWAAARRHGYGTDAV